MGKKELKKEEGRNSNSRRSKLEEGNGEGKK